MHAHDRRRRAQARASTTDQVSYSSQARCNAWLWSLPQSSGIHYLTPWVSVHPSDVHSLQLPTLHLRSGTSLNLTAASPAMSSVTTTVVSLATTRQSTNATTPALLTAGADPSKRTGRCKSSHQHCHNPVASIPYHHDSTTGCRHHRHCYNYGYYYPGHHPSLGCSYS